MNYKNKSFTINSRKFDGQIHKKWKADLIEIQGDLLLFKGVFPEEIIHTHLGVIRPGTISYEFYWINRWYNIFRFHEPEGNLRNFYCNINQPLVLDTDVLDYVDLDIDVLVWKDLSYEVLDLDEFNDNARKYKYSTDLIQKAHISLNEILNLVKNKLFPFDLDIR
jgi:protein associated with RNAse G/E